MISRDIFALYKMAFVGYLGFLYCRNLNCCYGSEEQYTPVKVTKPLLRYGGLSIFSKWQWHRPPSWICCRRFETTHEDYLVVFIFVKNLVEIDSFDIMQVLIFCDFGLKTPIHVQNVFGVWPLNVTLYHRDLKKHFCWR